MLYESKYLGITIDLSKVTGMSYQDNMEPEYTLSGRSSPNFIKAGLPSFTLELQNGYIEWGSQSQTFEDDTADLIRQEGVEISNLLNSMKDLESLESDIGNLQDLTKKDDESVRELLEKAFDFENASIKGTLIVPNKPNKNGRVYTKKELKKAVNLYQDRQIERETEAQKYIQKSEEIEKRR